MEFTLYPFSFSEFLDLYRPIAGDEPIQKCFQKYLVSGGMPYLANIRYADKPSRQYLLDLFHSVQLKDILIRNKILYHGEYREAVFSHFPGEVFKE